MGIYYLLVEHRCGYLSELQELYRGLGNHTRAAALAEEQGNHLDAVALLAASNSSGSNNAAARLLLSICRSVLLWRASPPILTVAIAELAMLQTNRVIDQLQTATNEASTSSTLLARAPQCAVMEADVNTAGLLAWAKRITTPSTLVDIEADVLTELSTAVHVNTLLRIERLQRLWDRCSTCNGSWLLLIIAQVGLDLALLNASQQPARIRRAGGKPDLEGVAAVRNLLMWWPRLRTAQLEFIRICKLQAAGTELMTAVDTTLRQSCWTFLGVRRSTGMLGPRAQMELDYPAARWTLGPTPTTAASVAHQAHSYLVKELDNAASSFIKGATEIAEALAPQLMCQPLPQGIVATSSSFSAAGLRGELMIGLHEATEAHLAYAQHSRRHDVSTAEMKKMTGFLGDYRKHLLFGLVAPVLPKVKDLPGMLLVRGSPSIQPVLEVMMEEVLLHTGALKGRPSRDWEQKQIYMWKEKFYTRFNVSNRPQPPIFTSVFHPNLSFDDLGRVILLQVSTDCNFAGVVADNIQIMD